MSNVKNNAAAQETRRKLIDAAGEVFADRGLHAATIKQITDRAGVNVAAINYHFSDKFELYAAVIRHTLSLTPIAPSAAEQAGSPQDRLRSHIAHLIDDLYTPARPRWHATLLAHEFAQPTAALDGVVEELIRPRADSLISIIRDILGPEASEEQVLRCGLSVGAQCFLYIYQREIVRRLHPQLLRDDNRDDLVNHVAEFSLAALHTIQRRFKSTGCRRLAKPRLRTKRATRSNARAPTR